MALKSHTISARILSKKMSVNNVISLAVAIIFTCNFASTSSECLQLTPCSCVLPNGMGYNLTKLAEKGTIQGQLDNYIFYFHPCEDAKILVGNDSNSECMKDKGVSLCSHNSKENKTESFGTVQESKFGVQNDNGATAQIVFSHTSSTKSNITTTISLICVSVDKPNLVPEYLNNPFRLLVYTPLACQTRIYPEGLSTGSVLVILLFVFSGVYLVGGALAMKVLRGATGWEMLPNYAFWSDLPALVRDGIVFTFSGCKVDSYDRI